MIKYFSDLVTATNVHNGSKVFIVAVQRCECGNWQYHVAYEENGKINTFPVAAEDYDCDLDQVELLAEIDA